MAGGERAVVVPPHQHAQHELHHPVPVGDVSGVKIVDKVEQLGWGDPPQVGHADGYLREWQEGQAIEHAAKMFRRSIAPVVGSQAQLLDLSPCTLSQVKKTPLPTDVRSKYHLYSRYYCTFEVGDNGSRVAVEAERREGCNISV